MEDQALLQAIRAIVREEVQTETGALRKEVQSEISELRSDTASLREEMKSEISELRSDTASLREEMKSEISELRSDSASIKEELKEIHQGIDAIVEWVDEIDRKQKAM